MVWGLVSGRVSPSVRVSVRGQILYAHLHLAATFQQIIPREAAGYSVELFGLSVCPHPWRGPLLHVCGHTYHRTTMIHTFLESPSDLDVHPRIR